MASNMEKRTFAAYSRNRNSQCTPSSDEEEQKIS